MEAGWQLVVELPSWYEAELAFDRLLGDRTGQSDRRARRWRTRSERVVRLPRAQNYSVTVYYMIISKAK